MKKENVTPHPHNLNVFSEAGFFYSISEADIDAYCRKEVWKFEKACIPLATLLCKHSKLVAYKDAGHFPQDIVSMAEKSFPKGNQQQEKYDFAVEQLKTQIESLQNELAKPEITALLTRFEDAEAECLKYFNAPTINSNAYPPPGWKTFRDLKNSSNRVQRGQIVDHLLYKIKYLQRESSDFMKQKMVKEAGMQYQETTNSLQGKASRIREPGSSSASSMKKDNETSLEKEKETSMEKDKKTGMEKEETQELTPRGLASFWKSIRKTIRRH